MKDPQLNNPNDPLNQTMQAGDMRRLIFFMLMTVGIYLLFDTYVMKPRVDAINAAQEAQFEALEKLKKEDGPALAGLEKKDRQEILSSSVEKRISFDNGEIFGSISTKGARIDDLSLSQYYKKIDKVDKINMLSPSGSLEPEYAEFGWVSASKVAALPTAQTVWSSDATTLSVDTPVVMSWDNGQGLIFEREIALDKNFLITVTQRVTNASEKDVTLAPYALISQHGMPSDLDGRYIMHEGPIGYIDGDLIELTHDELEDEKEQKASSVAGGWIGITAKYWLTSLMPKQDQAYRFRFKYVDPENELIPNSGRYQVDMTGLQRGIEAGKSIEVVTYLFSGAKKVNMLEDYSDSLGINHFDLAVDFGWFYFLTRPFYEVLTFINEYVGNIGIAIILFTIILRVMVFPLANMSFRSFANLRKVSPKIVELRDTYKDDKTRLQQELMNLYQKEGVNPMAGCLPIIAQIPIFFSMYKVLYVAIEMRHAPFFGWILDLSQPDPTSFFNLFGALPFDPPSMLMIGGWPCLMLCAMLMQRRLNPPAQDPMQEKMMALFPFFITFILSGFAAGLVIYWTVSNSLSVLQQYILMKSMGVEVSFFKRTKAEQKLEKMVEDGPNIHPEAALIAEELEDSIAGEIHGDEQPKKISPPKPKKKKKK